MGTAGRNSGRLPFAFGKACIFSLATLLAIALGGCTPSGPELGQVSGVVTLDGSPLPEAFVFFKHTNGGRIARAVTDEEGKYQLNFSLSNSGAIVGPNDVRISTKVEALRDDAGKMIPGTGKKELVPKKYNQDTELKVDVQRGKNELNFDLSSAGGKASSDT